MPGKIRFGVLGAARIVKRAIAAGMARSRSARLESIASRRLETAAAWAAELGIPRCHESYAALLDDPLIDAVYIPLPNELHREWTIRAAESGKHVLCEKPLALSAAEADEMAAVCRRRGVILMEAFVWRHHPRAAAARRLVAEGKIGSLRLIKMDFSFNIDPGDWRLDPARGGGALFDLGCYAIDAARYFTGNEPIAALASAQRHASGVDMTFASVVRFPNVVLAAFDCSFEAVYRNRLEIVGERGSIEMPGGVLPGAKAELIVRNDAGVETIPFDETDQYAHEVDAFCDSIAAGRLVDPAEDGVKSMRAVEMVATAASRRSES